MVVFANLSWSDLLGNLLLLHDLVDLLGLLGLLLVFLFVQSSPGMSAQVCGGILHGLILHI